MNFLPKSSLGHLTNNIIILLHFVVFLGNNIVVQVIYLHLYPVLELHWLVTGLQKSWCMLLRGFNAALTVKTGLQSGCQDPSQLEISSSYVEMAFKQRACQTSRILELIFLAKEWVHFTNNSLWNQPALLDATPLSNKSYTLTSNNVVLSYGVPVSVRIQHNSVLTFTESSSPNVTFIYLSCIFAMKNC